MKIKHVEIRNFRAIKEFDHPFDDITSFIGYNGGGKSSILHAIEWFFEGWQLQESDHFQTAEGTQEDCTISVTITFTSLTAEDKQNFGKYARSSEMKLTRCEMRDGGSKLYGDSLECRELRTALNSETLAKTRKAISELANDSKFESFKSMDKKATKAAIVELIDAWESDPSNAQHLSNAESEDVNNFLGATGTPRLKNHAGFIFVPAAPDLTGEFDSGNKESSINLLLADIIKGAVGESVERWQNENADVLADLEETVKRASGAPLQLEGDRVNKYLQKYLPDASLRLEVGLDEWKPKANPIARSSISIGSREDHISYQGHGTQRAALLALLQAVGERRNLSSTRPGGPSAATSLIVCIEEPEVYQHPVQARALAHSFKQAAKSGNIQFIFATHSPYFVSPDYLQSTYRVSSSKDGSQVHAATPTQAFESHNRKGKLEKYYLKSVIDGLFSRGVLIVEGDTEEAIFSNVRFGDDHSTLKDHGISVINADGGNNVFQVASLFLSYHVPVYVLHDGDADIEIARQRAENDVSNRPEKYASVDERVKELLASWQQGVDAFLSAALEAGILADDKSPTWGDGLFVGTHVALLPHDLEAELESWPDFRTQANLIGVGQDLRSEKRAGTFARAVSQSDPSSCPRSIISILEAAVDMCNS